MIGQPKPHLANQPHRECLYAWYPEAIDDNVYDTPMDPRDIYVHNGLDRDLLEQKPSTNGFTSTQNNSRTNSEIIQRYQQSIAPSDLVYHSTETINEALNPPWALHYQVNRRPATPNLPSNTNEMSSKEEAPRRLKSAPVVRSVPSTAILTIPEPRFFDTIIPVPTATIIVPVPVPPPSSPPLVRPKSRASSAKARLNNTLPNETKPITRRDIRSAHVSRRTAGQSKLSNEEIQQIFKRIYGENHDKPPSPQVEPVQIIYTEPQTKPPPVYVYQKSATWCPEEVPAAAPVRKSLEVTAVPLNPHYLHRPGVIAVRNVEKPSVVRENPTLKRSTRHPRRYQSLGKRNEPLLAFNPMPHKPRLSLEIDGVKLTYDSKLTLQDKSTNMTKYFIDGRLYLIKDQRYNVFDNVDPKSLDKYNQTVTHHPRPKYYQTVPVEKFQIPPPSPEVHYNASDTYFYHTSPKRSQRYVIDPHFISENLNVNRMPISQRPYTATVHA